MMNIETSREVAITLYWMLNRLEKISDIAGIDALEQASDSTGISVDRLDELLTDWQSKVIEAYDL